MVTNNLNVENYISDYLEFMRTSTEEIAKLRTEQMKIQDEIDDLITKSHPLSVENNDKFLELQKTVVDYYDKINNAMDKQNKRTYEYQIKIKQETF